MSTYTLTELQYSEDRKGPWRLYIYAKNGRGYEKRQWFSKKVKYADEEISVPVAKEMVDKAIANRQQVRITDGGDMLVFHSESGITLFGENFWKEIV